MNGFPPERRGGIDDMADQLLTDRRSGHQRRQEVRRGDDVCAQCEIYRDQERTREADNQKDHDAMWTEMKSQRGGALPRWVFILAVTAMVGVAGVQWNEIRGQGKTHSDQMEKISNTLSGLAQTQAVMMVKVERLEKALP